MTRRLVTIEVVGGGIFIVRGWLAHKLAIEAGLRPTFLGTYGGWAADTRRLPDLVAHLERRRIACEVIEPEPEDRDVHEPGDHGDGAISTDAPLFELDGGR